MDPVQRQRYAEALVAQGGQIDLAHIGGALGGLLRGAKLEPDALASIAGTDHVIRTEVEFRALLDKIDAQPNVGVAQRDRTILAIGAHLGVAFSPSTPPPSADVSELGVARPATGMRANQPRTLGPDGESIDARGARGQASIQYADGDLPQVRDAATSPEPSNWFVAIFEFLFQWIPGVDTHAERLEKFGEGLADRHQSELLALESGVSDRLSDQAQEGAMSRGVSGADVRAELRGRLIEDLSTRMMTDASARGQTLSKGDARERAATAVDAMLDRFDHNRGAAAGRRAELGVGTDPRANTPALQVNADRMTGALAEHAIPGRDLATRLGQPFSALYATAMARPAASHPTVKVQPDEGRRFLAEIAVRTQNIGALESAMALKASGRIAHVPDTAVAGIVQAQQRGEITSAAVPRALSALEHLPLPERQRVLSALEALPADKRGAAYALIGREQFGLSSSDATERQGSVRRIENAATQLARMSGAEAATALRRGTLGLDGPVQVRVTSGSGRSQRSVDVPVYIHPSVTDDQRDRYIGLLRSAYQNVPPKMMDRLTRSEGDEPFNVQIYGTASLDTGRYTQDRPDGSNPAGGYFQPEDNEVRLNAGLFDQMRAVHGEANGNQRIEIMMLHETVHYFDDLGNTEQNVGLFVNRFPDVAVERGRTEGAGDLAPAWDHFKNARDRFEEVRGDVAPGSTNDATVAYGLRNSRAPADERRVAEATDRMAARSGVVSGYAAAANPGGARNNSLAEWWAETYSNYLDPSTRDRLRAVDPVAHLAAQRYTEAIDRGVPADQALQGALRHALSTRVSGHQGSEILRAAPADGPLPAGKLAELESIGRAYADHAQALDGWRPYENDAGLVGLRASEATGGAASGRTLLGLITSRRQTLEARGLKGSDEYRRLGVLEASLTRSVGALEVKAEALSPPPRPR